VACSCHASGPSGRVCGGIERFPQVLEESVSLFRREEPAWRLRDVPLARSYGIGVYGQYASQRPAAATPCPSTLPQRRAPRIRPRETMLCEWTKLARLDADVNALAEDSAALRKEAATAATATAAILPASACSAAAAVADRSPTGSRPERLGSGWIPMLMCLRAPALMNL